MHVFRMLMLVLRGLIFTLLILILISVLQLIPINTTSNESLDAPPINLSKLLFPDPEKLSNSDIIEVPATFEDGDPAWQDLRTKFYNVKKGTHPVFTLKWSGYGGSVSEGQRVTTAMQEAEKNGALVNIDVIGLAASMHAYSVCYASNVTLEPGAVLVFHPVKNTTKFLLGLFIHTIKGTGGPAFAEYIKEEDNVCMQKGFVTPMDLQMINVYHMTVYKVKMPDGTIQTISRPNDSQN